MWKKPFTGFWRNFASFRGKFHGEKHFADVTTTKPSRMRQYPGGNWPNADRESVFMSVKNPTTTRTADFSFRHCQFSDANWSALERESREGEENYGALIATTHTSKPGKAWSDVNKNFWMEKWFRRMCSMPTNGAFLLRRLSRRSRSPFCSSVNGKPFAMVLS